MSAEPGQALEVTDPARAVRLVFWAASVGAVLLAGIGVAAVAVSNVAARRAEVAVLRALGMTPRAQARSRLTELVGVLVAATVFGGLAGWAVSLLVVPDLARSTIPQGVASIPATLALTVGPWLAVLGLMVAILVLVGSVLVARVRAQALDADYREEVR
ncbi:FtsX-like permease family protein [Ornithinimicrobium sp. INDO-MA30-4]|uniref:FtsX-like permease family protein n=1 Tax=Ornithinimicrobium sp. INDO-MA30-4 TaxID=2908651 RepID=UPI001F26663A|nr:ABC transporter permease [Ornithinimicrobium sp. INDO-MA30-4]UJH69688.1 ABC transporter permease [Ornithinimicrobium sp. INDO-MA30-4]